MKYAFYYETEIGKMAIAEEDEAIVEIAYQNEITDAELKETPLIKKAFEQLSEYFKGERKEFDLPLNPKGTDFQKKVWNALCEIPYGRTSTYKEIAAKIKNRDAARAVGMANNKNPLMIIIPCHRIIGSNGDLVGYAGGLDLKQKLLVLENA